MQRDPPAGNFPSKFSSGHGQVAEVLLRAGAKWTVLTKKLQTPYDLAVARGLKIEALKIHEASHRHTFLAADLVILQSGVVDAYLACEEGGWG